MEDLKYWVWLSSLPGIGARRFYQLLQYFETAENVFNSTSEELKVHGVLNYELIKIVTTNRNVEKIDKYLKKVKDNGINVYLSKQEEYPVNLKNIYDPPPVLYSLGELKPEDKTSVGIVGSRKASEYGLKTAEKLAEELAQEGVTIVSGMALGIDAAAHRGALRAKGRTIAVFACGVTNPHPKSNINIYKEIIKTGAVVSEYPLGMAAKPGNFPARNRIISGLSLGTLVVEANIRSGSLITADFALEQNREVFAVPGNINSPSSMGTNNLIKNGAKLIDCAADILSELLIDFTPSKHSLMNIELTDAEIQITASLIQCGKGLDQLAQDTGLDIGDLLSSTAILELKGIIKSVNGIYYSELTK